MEAEELIKKIKKFIEEELGSYYEPIITPTKHNPKDLQFDVSIIVMKRVKDGSIPKFHINVKDLVRINNSIKIQTNDI